MFGFGDRLSCSPAGSEGSNGSEASTIRSELDDNMIYDLRAKMEWLEDKSKRVESENEGFKGVIEDHKRLLEAKDGEVDEQKSKIKELEGALVGEKNGCTGREDQIQAAQKHAHNLESMIDDHARVQGIQLAQTRSVNEDLIRENGEAQATLEATGKEHEKVKQENIELKKQMQATDEQLLKIGLDVKVLDQEKNKLCSEVDAKGARIEELEGRLIERAETCKRMERELEITDNSLAGARRMHGDATKELEELRQQAVSRPVQILHVPGRRARHEQIVIEQVREIVGEKERLSRRVRDLENMVRACKGQGESCLLVPKPQAWEEELYALKRRWRLEVDDQMEKFTFFKHSLGNCMSEPSLAATRDRLRMCVATLSGYVHRMRSLHDYAA